ncbi:8-amino-7-oxononanoate synthase [Synechococcus sp. RSCCF101]|uniref:aminotransferase class I/II-fold pyridoxal phosphate-dependent enzyme n=1 Tax=Synechococcus sp. RSCCF101 TaxID=2511069 RepID=UPI001CD94003|nr:8-amino-7-oxononanoate synthase [Synechococcus sp. RSCCF101]
MVPPSRDPAIRDLAQQLTALPTDGRRVLRCLQPSAESGCLESPTEPGRLVDLASNDYLGLSRHPQVLAAAARAMREEGLGAAASPLVTGRRPSHRVLEEELARWLGRERALLFPSGFQANLAAVVALTGRRGVVLADRLSHHSLLAGVRCSGARLQRFAHNDLADLERRLTACEASHRTGAPPPLVISESCFSMEGSSPDVAALAGLCARHGARLLVDEAHALGVLGEGGRGLCHRLNDPVTLITGTFGKAFGSGGAFLAGDAVMGDWLLQTSGAYRYSTALAPPLAAAALAALQLIETHPGWVRELAAAADIWRQRLTAAGWPPLPGRGPILPLIVGSDAAALTLQQELERAGVLCIAIRPPTVPPGSARIRLVVRRQNPAAALETVLTVLDDVGGRLKAVPHAP